MKYSLVALVLRFDAIQLRILSQNKWILSRCLWILRSTLI